MGAALLLKPTTVDEACQMLEADDEAIPLAGGTALEVLRRLGLLATSPMIDLGGLRELQGIEPRSDHLRLGAGCTLREVERHPVVRARIPILSQAYGKVGNVRVRNAATVGGNLAYADYRIDAPAALLVLGALARLRTRSASREVPIREFFRDLELTELRPGELVTDVFVPWPPEGARGHFRKLVSLAENDWPCAGVAALLRVREGHRLLDLGLTALAPTPRHVQVDVSGFSLRQAVDAADAAVVPLIDPIADFRGSSAFKRKLGRVATREAVEAVWSH